MRTVALLIPSFLTFTWTLWYCVQARWGEVIAPNWQWLVLGTAVATCIVWWLTREKMSKAIVVNDSGITVVSQEKLVAREVYTWRTIRRERSIYAEPK